MPGLVEAKLNENRVKVGLSKSVRIDAARIDNVALSRSVDYVDNYMSGGQYNLIIIRTTPDEMRDDASTLLRRLREHLREEGTELIVFLMPEERHVSPIDAFPYLQAQSTPNFDFEEYSTAEREAIGSLRLSGVPFISALDDLVKFETAGNANPLWPYGLKHPDQAGRHFEAGEVYKGLARERPWKLESGVAK